MDGTASVFIGAVSALVPVGVLAFAGLQHLLHPRRLLGTLGRQRLLPETARWIAAFLLPSGELLIGIGGVWAIISGQAVLGWLLTGCAATYMVFAGYALVLIRVRPDAPCGCSGGEAPANAWVVARAVLLGLVAFYAAATVEGSAVPTGMGPEQLVMLLASAAIGLILWQLPAALDESSSFIAEVDR